MSMRTADDRIVTFTAGLGMLLSTLDTGIINVALPSLATEFNVDVATITWSIAIYVLTLSAMIVPLGRMGDRYGRVRVYAAGLVVFALGSAVIGASTSAAMLIVCRALQGMGAAMLQATAAALITTLVTPERRGTALGTFGLMIGLGPVLGPVFGGFVLSSMSWKWLFWINLPLCALGLIGCTRLREAPRPRETFGLDLAGNALLTAAIATLLLAIEAPLARTSAWALGGVCVVLLALFVLRETRAAHPMVDLQLFRSPAIALPMLGTVAFGAASAVVFIVPPFFLERALHFEPWRVGWVALAAPLGLVSVARWSGSAISRLGTHVLMTAGVLLMLVGLLGLALAPASWGVIPMSAWLLVYGIGGGLFQPPNIAAVMGAVGPNRQGTTGAVQRMVQNIAIAVGAAVAANFLRAATDGEVAALARACHEAWAAAAAFVAVSLIGFFILTLRQGPGRIKSAPDGPA
jgi:EmrB/QacA subfamily drug resistance transporter